MNKLFKQILILVCLIAVLILPYFVFAGNPALDKLEQVAETEGPYADVKETTISEIAGTAVNAFLSLLGVIFIILILLAGYNWMTASGHEEKIKKAKETIWRAIIGLLIVVGAYAIWRFIFVKIM
jgi:amino acid transporter